MFSGNEWIIVVIVALVLFGGSQIPKLARSLGQAQKEFKAGIADGADESAAESSADTTDTKK
jgi:sec-independent protein translocase protein TatA